MTEEAARVLKALGIHRSRLRSPIRHRAVLDVLYLGDDGDVCWLTLPDLASRLCALL